MKPFSWNPSEPRIQEYLIDAYRKTHQTINFHDAGAAVEKGADVWVRNENEERVFAVKIKPKSTDIKQFKVFLENKQNLVYVYLFDPPRPTFEIMELQSNNRVTFMNSGRLHNHLLELRSTDYAQDYMYSHALFDTIIETLKIWETMRESDPSGNSLPIDLLWRWKDKSVSMNKSARTIHHILDRSISELYDETPDSYATTIEQLTDALNLVQHEAAELKSIYEIVRRKYPGVGSHTWQRCAARSNWIGIMTSIERGASPRDVLYHWIFDHAPRDDPYAFLIHVLKRTQDICEGFEDAVDWFFEDEYLQKLAQKQKI